MNFKIKHSATLLCLIGLLSCKAHVSNENTMVLIKTSMGDIKIKLYDSTPVHRDNFIHLVRTGFYEGVTFHRVIKNFMIQSGDPESKTNLPANFPDSLKNFTIPAEINNMYFHKKGALAAARQGDDVNPQKRSSGTQFYIVQGIRFSDDELNQSEQRINSSVKQNQFNAFMKETSDSVRLSGKTLSEAEVQEIASIKMYKFLSNYKDIKMPDDRRNIYKTLGGTPRLDGNYTVFGEVTEGLDIVDKIASAPTDNTDKPVDDVRIVKIKIVKK